MKLSKLWKSLTRDQRRAWNAWAKSNDVLLGDGSLRRVSGHKAMTVILQNRALAGDAASPSVLPAAATWLNGALTLNDAGPFTENAGFVGFRTAQDIPTATKWFVWATRPVDASETNPHRLLRFVKCLALSAMTADDLTPSFGSDYQAVNGPWDGPGEEGEWPVDTFIWFRVHQYSAGQIGPGVVLKGRIQIEL